MASFNGHVLSSVAMKSSGSTKIMILLLLVIFLLTSMGTFGYAWCVGDDGHVEVNYAAATGCCNQDQSPYSGGQSGSPGLSRAGADYCGLCLDFDAQKYEAVFFKRIKKSAVLSLEPLTKGASYPNAISNSGLVAKMSPQQQFRVAQIILALRTIVLLN